MNVYLVLLVFIDYFMKSQWDGKTRIGTQITHWRMGNHWILIYTYFERAIKWLTNENSLWSPYLFVDGESITAIQSNSHLSHAHMSTVVMCVARILRFSEQNVNYPLRWKYFVSFNKDEYIRMYIGDKCQKYQTTLFVRLSTWIN